MILCLYQLSVYQQQPPLGASDNLPPAANRFLLHTGGYYTKDWANFLLSNSQVFTQIPWGMKWIFVIFAHDGEKILKLHDK